MATFRSCIKYLKSTCESFLLYLLVEILQLVHKISSFPEVPYKRGILTQIFYHRYSQINTRSSDSGVLTKDALKNFAKFEEKHLCRSLIFRFCGKTPVSQPLFNKVAAEGLQLY